MRFDELRGQVKVKQKEAWRECKRQHRVDDHRHEVLREIDFEELLTRRKQINDEYFAKLRQLGVR